MSPVHMSSKLLVALICATSINATSQSASTPDVTGYDSPLTGSAGVGVSDQELEAAVARELGHDPLIDASTIEVVATAHVITLTGTQPLLIGRERATYVAETVKGCSPSDR